MAQNSSSPLVLSTDLRIATGRLNRALRRQRGGIDLAEGQFCVLAVLGKHGPMSPGALAEHEQMRPPSMTKIVNLLAELDLVSKSPHPVDGRQVSVKLTEKGAQELKEIRRRRDAWLTQRLAKLDDTDRKTLAEAARILRDLMDQ